MSEAASSSPRSARYRAQQRRPVEDQELEAAVSRVLGLPLGQRLRAFELLSEDLGGEIGVESAVARQARERVEALTVLTEAAALLELPDGQAPTVSEYERAHQEHGLPLSSGQVRAAFGSWDNAKAALLDQWLPLTPAQRAIRRGSSGVRREQETYLEALRIWLRAHPTGGGRDDYNAWVRLESERRLARGDPTLPSYEAIHNALLLSWDRALKVARGDLTLGEAQDDQLGLDLRHIRPGTLAVSAAIGQLLRMSRSSVQQLFARDDFPRTVARVGRQRVWLVSDLLAYRDGEPFPKRRDLELNGCYLDSQQLAERLGRSNHWVRTRTWHQRWDLIPETVPILGELLVWDRLAVEEWEQRRDAGETGDDAEPAWSVSSNPELLARRVRTLRLERGLGQQGLADRAGVRQSQISKLETTRTSEPSLETVVRMANALGVSLDALLGVGDCAGTAEGDKTSR